MSDLPTLVILGDRTANEVLEAAQLACSSQFSRIDKLYYEADRFAAVDAPRIANTAPEVFFHAGMANNELKHLVVEHCLEFGWKPFTIVHPSAIVAPSASISVGTFIAPLAVVSSHVIVEPYAIIHIHASIGHDAHIGEYAAILPGARISGKVVVGKRSLVGSNAFVAAGKIIGHDCRIDALSYVQQDVAEGYIVSPRYHQPLKRVEQRVAKG